MHRRIGALVVVASAVTAVLWPSAAGADGASDVRKAEAQIGAAAKRADSLAARLNASESQAARLAGQAEQAQRRFDEVAARALRTNDAMRVAAVLDYTNA